MRYQHPVANPLSQYWEEQLSLAGLSWRRDSFWTNIRLFCSEHIFGNLLLFISLVARLIAMRPLFDLALTAYERLQLKWLLKRTVDVIGAIVGLIITSPLFIILPVLIKLESPGPAFYLQERVGQNRRRRDRRVSTTTPTIERRMADRRQTKGYGRPFTIIKFRTMYQNAEQASGPTWAVKGDPRVTRVGAFLRATRLDEVPQLINVLKGEMSLVGPRPERSFFVEKLCATIPGYEKRLLVKPGLTGLAQVEHKYDESLDDVRTKVKYDLAYVRNVRILRDLAIMIRTVYVVLAAKGM